MEASEVLRAVHAAVSTASSLDLTVDDDDCSSQFEQAGCAPGSV